MISLGIGFSRLQYTLFALLELILKMSFIILFPSFLNILLFRDKECGSINRMCSSLLEHIFNVYEALEKEKPCSS